MEPHPRVQVTSQIPAHLLGDMQRRVKGMLAQYGDTHGGRLPSADTITRLCNAVATEMYNMRAGGDASIVTHRVPLKLQHAEDVAPASPSAVLAACATTACEMVGRIVYGKVALLLRDKTTFVYQELCEKDRADMGKVIAVYSNVFRRMTTRLKTALANGTDPADTDAMRALLCHLAAEPFVSAVFISAADLEPLLRPNILTAFLLFADSLWVRKISLSGKEAHDPPNLRSQMLANLQAYLPQSPARVVDGIRARLRAEVGFLPSNVCVGEIVRRGLDEGWTWEIAAEELICDALEIVRVLCDVRRSSAPRSGEVRASAVKLTDADRCEAASTVLHLDAKRMRHLCEAYSDDTIHDPDKWFVRTAERERVQYWTLTGPKAVEFGERAAAQHRTLTAAFGFIRACRKDGVAHLKARLTDAMADVGECMTPFLHWAFSDEHKLKQHVQQMSLAAGAVDDRSCGVGVLWTDTTDASAPDFGGIDGLSLRRFLRKVWQLATPKKSLDNVRKLHGCVYKYLSLALDPLPQPRVLLSSDTPLRLTPLHPAILCRAAERAFGLSRTWGAVWSVAVVRASSHASILCRRRDRAPPQPDQGWAVGNFFQRRLVHHFPDLHLDVGHQNVVKSSLVLSGRAAHWSMARLDQDTVGGRANAGAHILATQVVQDILGGTAVSGWEYERTGHENHHVVVGSSSLVGPDFQMLQSDIDVVCAAGSALNDRLEIVAAAYTGKYENVTARFTQFLGGSLLYAHAFRFGVKAAVLYGKGIN